MVPIRLQPTLGTGKDGGMRRPAFQPTTHVQPHLFEGDVDQLHFTCSLMSRDYSSSSSLQLSAFEPFNLLHDLSKQLTGLRVVVGSP